MPYEKKFALANVLEVTALSLLFRSLFYADQYNVTHAEKYWEMLFVETNKIRAKTPTGTHTIEAGQAIFHRPGEVHYHYNDSDKNSMIIECCFYVSGEYINTLENAIVSLSNKEIMLLKNAVDMVNLTENAHLPPHEINSVKQQFIKLNLELFLFHTIETHILSESADISKKYYETIINVLHDNVYNRLTTDDIANLCHLSKSSVKQIFHRYHGGGVMEHFNKLKINEAKYHIAQGIPISTISESMSFSSQNYFSVFFKRETGMTPLEYRNFTKTSSNKKFPNGD